MCGTEVRSAPRQVVADFRAEMRGNLAGPRASHNIIRRWMRVDTWLEKWMTRTDDDLAAFIAAHGGPAPTRKTAQR